MNIGRVQKIFMYYSRLNISRVKADESREKRL